MAGQPGPAGVQHRPIPKASPLSLQLSHPHPISHAHGALMASQPPPPSSPLPPPSHPLPLTLHPRASTEPQEQRGTPGCPQSPQHSTPPHAACPPKLCQRTHFGDTPCTSPGVHPTLPTPQQPPSPSLPLHSVPQGGHPPRPPKPISDHALPPPSTPHSTGHWRSPLSPQGPPITPSPPLRSPPRALFPITSHPTGPQVSTLPQPHGAPGAPGHPRPHRVPPPHGTSGHPPGHSPSTATPARSIPGARLCKTHCPPAATNGRAELIGRRLLQTDQWGVRN